MRRATLSAVLLAVAMARQADSRWDAQILSSTGQLSCLGITTLLSTERTGRMVTLRLPSPSLDATPITFSGVLSRANDFQFTWASHLQPPDAGSLNLRCHGTLVVDIGFTPIVEASGRRNVSIDPTRDGLSNAQVAQVFGPTGDVPMVPDVTNSYPLDGCPDCSFRVRLEHSFTDLILGASSTRLDVDVGIAAEEGGPRVLGGEPTAEYKNVGALLYRGLQRCTAMLVGRETLLTAAHCLFAENNAVVDVRDLRFVPGEILAREPDLAATIAQSKLAPGVTTGTTPYENDVALLYISEWRVREGAGEQTPPSPKMDLSRLFDPKACIRSILGCYIRAVGYGRTSSSPLPQGAPKEETRRRTVLLQADGPVRRSYFKISTPSNRDTCRGDSGGPVFHEADGSLVGLVSSGTNPCIGVGTYARLDVHSRWLVENLR